MSLDLAGPVVDRVGVHAPPGSGPGPVEVGLDEGLQRHQELGLALQRLQECRELALRRARRSTAGTRAPALITPHQTAGGFMLVWGIARSLSDRSHEYGALIRFILLFFGVYSVVLGLFMTIAPGTSFDLIGPFGARTAITRATTRPSSWPMAWCCSSRSNCRRGAYQRWS